MDNRDIIDIDGEWIDVTKDEDCDSSRLTENGARSGLARTLSDSAPTVSRLNAGTFNSNYFFVCHAYTQYHVIETREN